MLSHVMLLNQIQEKTGLKLELPGNLTPKDEGCSDGTHCHKKRIFYFEVVDTDDGESLTTIVFPTAWLGKLKISGIGTIIAAVVWAINSGLIG